jgi:hypothetical protein
MMQGLRRLHHTFSYELLYQKCTKMFLYPKPLWLHLNLQIKMYETLILVLMLSPMLTISLLHELLE